MHRYRTQGVCSKAIDVDIDGDVVRNVVFHGGCPGNLSAISKLVEGMPADKVIELLAGNTCGNRASSCADQLTKAIEEARSAQ